MRRIVLAVAGTAVAGMAACSHSAAPASGPGSHGTSSAQNGSVPVPVSCSQRYQAWANASGKTQLAAFHAVSVAVATADSQTLTVTLHKAKPAVTTAALHPLPACADPRGYWGVLLMHVNAAIGGSPSAASVRAALKDVPAIEHNLTAELKSTSG